MAVTRKELTDKLTEFLLFEERRVLLNLDRCLHHSVDCVKDYESRQILEDLLKETQEHISELRQMIKEVIGTPKERVVKPTMNTQKMLEDSLEYEKEAVDRYTDFINKLENKSIAEKLSHIRDEEIEHVKKMGRVIECLKGKE